MPNIEIKVDGLAELRRALGRLDPLDARNELRDGLKEAADIVARQAKGKVPVRTGAARDSIRATAGGNRAYVVGGKARVPYYGWLDFGGRTPVLGNPRSVGPWSGAGGGPPKGRFIYAALDDKERQVTEKVADAVFHALRSAGF